MRARAQAFHRNALFLLIVVLAAASACGGGESQRNPGRASGAGPALDGPALGLASEPLPALPVVPAGSPTVVFLGDSIGAGLHLPEHRAFPAVLQARLVREQLPFELVSSCESGRTSAGGVTALDWVLRTSPALVVIELGGNDGLRGVPVEELERNLRELIERARAAGARVLLLGVRLPPNYGEYGERFDALYPRLAAEYDLLFVPSFMEGVGAVPAMNLPDGLHPTAAGHERLADNVQPTLRAALTALGGPLRRTGE